MAIYSSIFAWRIPGTEKFGRLQSLELQRVDVFFPDVPQSLKQCLAHDWCSITICCMNK